LFFALPYEPVYYFLSGKKSPTRQLIFFAHINIPNEQEEKIIRDLEKNKVNWIVLSNRSHSNQVGLGQMGIDYCPLIDKYIKDNFLIVAEFGDWVNPPGWIEHHGTRILKRK